MGFKKIKTFLSSFRNKRAIQRIGLVEGANFSSERYITAYPEASEGAILHYALKGKKENRVCYTPGDMGDKKEIPTSEMPFISFVVTSYNYAHLISETVNSLVAQTYRNFEIIVVDDGSKDNSLEVINDYVKKYSFIHLYTHPNGANKGLPASMRLGIEKANGEYVAFCESDDYLSPDYLQKKVDIVNNYKNVVIVSNAIRMFGDKHDIELRGWVCQHIRKLLKAGGTKVDLRYNQEFNFIPTLSSVMIRKDILLKLDYNSPVPAWLDFWLYRQILKDNLLYFVDEELTFWRQHDSFNGQKNSAKVVDKLKGFLIDSNKLIGL